MLGAAAPDGNCGKALRWTSLWCLVSYSLCAVKDNSDAAVESISISDSLRVVRGPDGVAVVHTRVLTTPQSSENFGVHTSAARTFAGGDKLQGASMAWLGGDSDASIDVPSLGENTTLWLFGDTLLGHVNSSGDNGPYREVKATTRATLSMSQGGDDARMYLGELHSDGFPASVWSPCADAKSSCCRGNEDWFWLMDGVGVGNQVVVLASRNSLTANNSFGFETTGTSVIVANVTGSVPTEWPFQCADLPLPSGNPVSSIDNKYAKPGSWTMALAIDPTKNNTAILLGSQPVGFFTIASYACTMTATDLLHLDFGSMLCLGETGSADASSALHPWSELRSFTALSLPGSSEASLDYNAELDSWYSFYLPPFGTTVELWTSTDGPFGAWTGRAVYAIPDPYNDTSKFFCYAVKSHPQLVQKEEDGSSDGVAQLAFSYVCNAFDIAVLGAPVGFDAYVPRFVLVDLDTEEKGRGALAQLRERVRGALSRRAVRRQGEKAWSFDRAKATVLDALATSK